ncbi:MAG: hypothetical protein LBT81_04415 [Helicobacteraceae bacterium]|jgi:hypothetical protein|nr:hypothetical protein [Helicobacteraceae bacterium]
MQEARALQAAVLADINDSLAVNKIRIQQARSIKCLFSTLNDSSLYPYAKAYAISTELEAITTNTKERLLAYLAFNHAMDGTATASPKGDTCE